MIILFLQFFSPTVMPSLLKTLFKFSGSETDSSFILLSCSTISSLSDSDSELSKSFGKSKAIVRVLDTKDKCKKAIIAKRHAAPTQW